MPTFGKDSETDGKKVKKSKKDKHIEKTSISEDTSNLDFSESLYRDDALIDNKQVLVYDDVKIQFFHGPK